MEIAYCKYFSVFSFVSFKLAFYVYLPVILIKLVLNFWVIL